MAAAVTCGRSIVRDLYGPREGARVMSRALTGLGVIAVASPVCGGLLVERFGWHAALLALAVFGAVTLATIAVAMRETVPQKSRDATRPAQILRNWKSVVANPTFRAWAALSGCTYGGLYVMLAGSSFVFIDVLGVGRATSARSSARSRSPTSAAPCSAASSCAATACAAPSVAAPGSRSSAAWARRRSASPEFTRSGRSCCRNTFMRSATASISRAARPARSAPSPRRPERRRRSRAS